MEPVQAPKRVKVLDFSPIIRNDISNFKHGGVGRVNILFYEVVGTQGSLERKFKRKFFGILSSLENLCIS
jgi:hypothetical protein